MLDRLPRAIRQSCFFAYLVTLLAVCNATWSFAETPDSLSQAFGVGFYQPIDPGLLRANISSPSYPFPPAGLPPVDTTLPDSLLPTWYSITPTQVPKVLQAFPLDYQVMLNNQLAPLRILVTGIIDSGCASLVHQLTEILNKKYGPPVDAPARAGFQSARKYTVGGTRIDVQCDATNQSLLLEYTDTIGYQAWHKEYQQAVVDYQKAQALLFADKIAMGGRTLLNGVFNIVFREPMPGYSDLPVDTTSSIEPIFSEPPFDQAGKTKFSVKVGPEGKPYEIRAIAQLQTHEMADQAMLQLGTAFRQKYGLPMKNSPRHLIFNISSDYLIVKRLSSKKIELVAIYRMGQQQSLRRKRLAEEQALADESEARRLAEEQARIKEEERQREWAKDTEGL